MRQAALLQALSTLPRVRIVFGKFKEKRIACAHTACPRGGRATPGLTVPEEKGTDVNIAVNMLDDAHCGRCDLQILVSGDSDLVPAVRIVRARFPAMKTYVYVPARTQQRGAAVELRNAAHKSNTLPLQPLARAQLPDPVPLANGLAIRKPTEW